MVAINKQSTKNIIYQCVDGEHYFFIFNDEQVHEILKKVACLAADSMVGYGYAGLLGFLRELTKIRTIKQCENHLTPIHSAAIKLFNIKKEKR